MRTPSNPRQEPPRAPASQHRHGRTEAASSTAASATERLVDALSDALPHATNDHVEAFESARKKFAMYGKQNAHVSHYSPNQHQRHRRQRQSMDTGAASPVVRRLARWDDSDSAGASNAAALQNTLLLQENGELAAQLDDMEYHLEGILASGSSGRTETGRGELAKATSVVALTKLLQLDHVQLVLKVASQSQELNTRVRAVLLTLRTLGHGVLRLSVAVMAYLLTMNADADEFFSHDVIDTVVAALAMECGRLGDGVVSTTVPIGQASGLMGGGDDGVESKTPLKKSFLKRKRSGSTRGVASAVEMDVFAPPSDREDEHKGQRARASARREVELRGELCALLAGQDAFLVDGQIQLSTADLLCMLLHNILQVGGASGGDATTESASFRPSTKQQPLRRCHQRQDLAGATFETIHTRKQQLIRNGGLDLLVQVLEKRFDLLWKHLADDLVRASVGLDLACAFQRVRTLLRVLDQVSFLATDVQVQMAKHETVFRVLLRLIDVLSTLAWSVKSRKKWQSDPSFMHLVVDVLMAAMRVLINLSHQNEDVNRHITTLDGTKILFLAFCKVWGAVQTAVHETIGEDRVVYDALLLTLSAITNCVEYSPDNRGQLSMLDLSATPLDGLEAFRASSPCSLLVSFFVSKVQSYIHLFEISDSQCEMEDTSWVPEDIVLGGCVSLLLGCLMKDSSYNSTVILGALPDASPRLLLRALSAFVALHSQIGALTPEVGKSVLEVEKVLKSFMTKGDEPSPSSSGRSLCVPTSAVGRSADSATYHTEITFKVTAMPQRNQSFEVVEVKGEEESEEAELSAESQPAACSPPASAFKLQKFSRVCSSIDDSDGEFSDVDPSPMKKKRFATPPKSPVRSPARVKPPKSPARSPVRANPPKSPTRSPARSNPPKSPARSPLGSKPPKSPARSLAGANLPNSQARSPARSNVPKSPARSPARANPLKSPSRSPARTQLTVMNATVTFSPMRRVSGSTAAGENRGRDLDGEGVALSIQRRLKQTRQLVSDLEAEFMKIGSRVSSELSAAAARMASKGNDGDDGMDGDDVDVPRNLLSTEYTSTVQGSPQLVKDTPQPVKGIPQKAAGKKAPSASLTTPYASSPLRRRVQTPETSRPPSTESSPSRIRAASRLENASRPFKIRAASRLENASSPYKIRAASTLLNASSPLKIRAASRPVNASSPLMQRGQTTATSNQRPAQAPASNPHKRKAKAAPPTIIRKVAVSKGAPGDIFEFDE
jgi:hypothetical protein